MLLSSFDERETLHFQLPNIEKGVIIIDLRVRSQKGVSRMYFQHTFLYSLWWVGKKCQTVWECAYVLTTQPLLVM